MEEESAGLGMLRRQGWRNENALLSGVVSWGVSVPSPDMETGELLGTGQAVSDTVSEGLLPTLAGVTTGQLDQ